MKKTIIGICVCSLLLTFGYASKAQQEPTARDLYLDFQKAAKKPAAQRPGKPGAKIKLELMRDNAQPIFVTTNYPLLNDDRIAFRTAINYEGYLTVTNIGTSGKVRVLYAGEVSPTSDMRIPEKGWIRVTGKSGDEVVNFILSSGPIRELQLIGNSDAGAASQDIMANANRRAVEQGRDLIVENVANETYVLAPSFQTLASPKGFSITLTHR